MTKPEAVPAQPDHPSTLREDLERLRAIPAAWKQRPDPLGELEEIRNGPAQPEVLGTCDHENHRLVSGEKMLHKQYPICINWTKDCLECKHPLNMHITGTGCTYGHTNQYCPCQHGGTMRAGKNYRNHALIQELDKECSSLRNLVAEVAFAESCLISKQTAPLPEQERFEGICPVCNLQAHAGSCKTVLIAQLSAERKESQRIISALIRLKEKAELALEEEHKRIEEAVVELRKAETIGDLYYPHVVIQAAISILTAKEGRP